jgi:hypothetical protein
MYMLRCIVKFGGQVALYTNSLHMMSKEQMHKCPKRLKVYVSVLCIFFSCITCVCRTGKQSLDEMFLGVAEQLYNSLVDWILVLFQPTRYVVWYLSMNPYFAS